MNSLESLISEYPELNFHFTDDLPLKLSGFIHEEDIWISTNNSLTHQKETLAEEIGHYSTSSGNILSLDSLEKRKQENVARRWGYMKIITLDGLIACFKNDILSLNDILDFFEVSEGYFWQAIDVYKQKYGITFKYYEYIFDLSHGVNIRNTKYNLHEVQ